MLVLNTYETMAGADEYTKVTLFLV